MEASEPHMIQRTGKTKRQRTANIAQGNKDRILERNAAQVNGHDLAKCEGWEGPLTSEERRDGASEWYTFWGCERCSRESVEPPHRWETIPCEPGVSR